MLTLTKDLKYGPRMLARNLGFAAVMVLTRCWPVIFPRAGRPRLILW